MRFKKRLFTIVLTMVLALQTLSLHTQAELSSVLADWKFDTSSVKQGSIENGDLVISDQSGNGNDLAMNVYKNKQPTADTSAVNWNTYLSFSDLKMDDSTSGSLAFNGDNSQGIGADLLTVNGAPINSNQFENGYTLEFMYYFPEDWTSSDAWMGLMARQVADKSNVSSMAEPELGSMSVAVSNAKEIQFLTAASGDNHAMSSAAWSVSMDKGGVWYHIAITSDGNVIRTFVNGAEAFRDYESDEMKGIFADPADGRFRIGSSWWKDGNQTLDKFLQGNLQRVRISDKALDKTEWLVQNPESYLGTYGSNDTFELKDESNYNFVFIPDTQNTVKFKPEVMKEAVQGLITDKDRLNVAGVVHLGDVVENNNDGEQYNNAREAFYALPDSGVKLLMQMGNHDGWSSGISNYWNSFSQNSAIFMEKTASYLTNNSPSGNSSYMVVSAGSYDYLVVSLSSTGSASGAYNNTRWDSNDETWLKNVLETFKNLPTIVTTHDLQNTSDTQPNSIKLSTVGQDLWNIVKAYDQVFMMVGGHSHGAGYEVLQNDNGKEVISVLADYQFGYNGGNGFFKFAEFSETDNKVYLHTYSPYSASLAENEKTFFDVNFMLGEGNDDEIALNFEQRFPDMKRKAVQTSTEGQWLSGEYHLHTNQSNDAQVATSKLENILDVAFREEGYTSIAGAANITSGSAFDYLFIADHFRRSTADADGNFLAANKLTTRYVAIAQQVRKTNELRALGKYQNAITYHGFEWDMPALDHVSVGIIDGDSDEVPIEGIRAFEWLYADQNADADSLFVDNGSAERALYGERKATSAGGRSDINVAYDGVEWLKENYPDSYLLFNHPSRHNGGSGVVTVESLRISNDIAPNIVFGFEGMPGNQLSPDETRAELNDIYGGADVMLSEVGGIWDSLLGEGRRFFNFANSDFHFKTNQTYSSGYYPGEYSRNYTFVEPGENQVFDFKDVVNGLRSGNSFAVYGDLIDALEFNASSNNDTQPMGGELNAIIGDTVTLEIRFKSPETNNYQAFGDHQSDVTNEVSVHHVDLIAGSISGKLDESQYSQETNETTQIIKTFYEADWGEKDAEDYYTIRYEVPADSDTYYRLRGTNLPAGTEGLTDAEGNPLRDQAYNAQTVTDFNERVNLLNDRNYRSLWFYSNPIFVYTQEAPQTHEVVFQDGFGNVIATQTVTLGETLDAIASPSKEGYTFVHWYAAGTSEDTAFDFSSPITKDLVLVAKWEAVKEPEVILELEGWNDELTVGESMTLTPNVASTKGADNWSWDSEFLSATFNSPATFTALKAGVTTITYTADSGEQLVKTLLIVDPVNTEPEPEPETPVPANPVDSGNDGNTTLPSTGYETPSWMLYGMLVLAAGVIVFAKYRSKHNEETE